MTHNAKITTLDLQRYYWKLYLLKYRIRYQRFCFFKLFIFICGFSLKVTIANFLFIIEAMEKLTEIKTFRVRKTTVSSTFLIRLRFQGYCCQSGIAIFARRVICNYAYSPFKYLITEMFFLKTKLERHKLIQYFWSIDWYHCTD